MPIDPTDCTQPVEILSDEDDEWRVSWYDGHMTIEMPEEDAREVETRAKEAGVSIEVYFRRRLGFPEEPPP